MLIISANIYKLFIINIHNFFNILEIVGISAYHLNIWKIDFKLNKEWILGIIKIFVWRKWNALRVPSRWKSCNRKSSEYIQLPTSIRSLRASDESSVRVSDTNNRDAVARTEFVASTNGNFSDFRGFSAPRDWYTLRPAVPRAGAFYLLNDVVYYFNDVISGI